MPISRPSSQSCLLAQAILRMFVVVFAIQFLFLPAQGQTNLEGKPVIGIEVALEDGVTDVQSVEQFSRIAKDTVGASYSYLKIRESISLLYATKKVERALVVAKIEDDGVILKYSIKRKLVLQSLTVEVLGQSRQGIDVNQMLIRLNKLRRGETISEQSIGNGVDTLLAYLFELGYFKSAVKQKIEKVPDGVQTNLHFEITPGPRAKVSAIILDIAGIDSAWLKKKLSLKIGSGFSRESVSKGAEDIKRLLRDKGFLAARLEEPDSVYDRERNVVEVTYVGEVGPPVNISVSGSTGDLTDAALLKVLPIRSEGTLDFSAIIEGKKKLEEQFQERGYFFAEVTPKCSAEPAFLESEASYTTNDTQALCSALSGAELANRKIEVKYEVELGRRLKLVDIRIDGFSDFRIDGTEIVQTADGRAGRIFPIGELKALLGTTQASLIGVVPYLGYGRGFTSTSLLTEDEEIIKALLIELGYLEATVRSKQGVSLEGEELIITFDVIPGPRTVIKEVQLRGNSKVQTATLTGEITRDGQVLIGKPYSRARVANAVKKLSDLYSREGFYDARVETFVETIPGETEGVRVVFSIENEGSKTLTGNIFVSGTDKVRADRILGAVNLVPGQLLKAADIFSAEQTLFATDLFKNVDIKTLPSGTPSGETRVLDLGITVEEQKSRLVTYGGGFSTDAGPFGSIDLRNFNLFGRLQQGGVRARLSRYRQLGQIDYVNPRFIKDGRNPDGSRRFSPLTLSIQYQRDATITRFFRSEFDKGTFGIVQRVNSNGDPIDIFGARTEAPVINKLSFNLETSRTLSIKHRTILFGRLRYEDVRLSNIESLLIANLLRPDAKIRIAGFGFNLVRDTRENCELRYSLAELASKGPSLKRCRYNPGDPTSGSYITAEYTNSVPVFRGAVGFHKLQLSVNGYTTPKVLRRTTLAGRGVFGVASVFKNGERFTRAGINGLDGILPISERFFAGGSQSLRGFDFESAGPRIVVVPQGVFRDGNGRVVRLNPFSVPFGGNGVALLNLEARIPISNLVRVVPFYDGGNVFVKPGDLFKGVRMAANSVFAGNSRSRWSSTFGLGVRFKAPVGGELAIDYGWLLKPPVFQIPQHSGPAGSYRLHQGQLHFRFSQAF